MQELLFVCVCSISSDDLIYTMATIIDIGDIDSIDSEGIKILFLTIDENL